MILISIDLWRIQMRCTSIASYQDHIMYCGLFSIHNRFNCYGQVFSISIIRYKISHLYQVISAVTEKWYLNVFVPFACICFKFLYMISTSLFGYIEMSIHASNVTEFLFLFVCFFGRLIVYPFVFFLLWFILLNLTSLYSGLRLLKYFCS